MLSVEQLSKVLLPPLPFALALALGRTCRALASVWSLHVTHIPDFLHESMTGERLKLFPRLQVRLAPNLVELGLCSRPCLSVREVLLLLLLLPLLLFLHFLLHFLLLLLLILLLLLFLTPPDSSLLTLLPSDSSSPS